MTLVFMTAFAIAAMTTTPPGEPYVPAVVEVIDGDTLRVDGQSVRITNLDTPERGGRAECDAERMLAAVATKRAEELIAKGEVLIYPTGKRDRYERVLARVTVNGVDWGQLMVSENVAVFWAGKTHDWCGPIR